MKSANLVQIGKIVIDEHCPEPKLTSPEQTLVRVRYACGSNFQGIFVIIREKKI